MPNMQWSKLEGTQFIGKYAEYYAKMEFISYGCDVYTPEVDSRGVDFVVNNHGTFYEVQVKSLRDYNFQGIKKDKLAISDRFLICFVFFEDGKLPNLYVFPTTVWETPNELFVDRNYDSDGQKSKPEYGIQFSRKNEPFLKQYEADIFFEKFVRGTINE